MNLPIYLTNARPSFAPTPGADVATIKAPDGSELLSAFGEPLLFVPFGHRTRMAMTASQAWLAARLGERGFAVIGPPRSPKQVRLDRLRAERHERREQHKAARQEKARQRAAREREASERLATIRRLKRQGQSLEAIGRAVGLSRGRVCTLWKHDQLRRLAESR
jgi:hypothetical protein